MTAPKKKKHICYPKPVDFFGKRLYQCGCGKYFMTEESYQRALQDWRSQFSGTPN